MPRRPALLASALPPLWLACSSPPAPVIPGRDQIGPPPEAAVNCPPPHSFAQREFRLADLETGQSCTGFLEQDECVIALYRDCTVLGNSRRAWQGAHDANLVLSFYPSCLSGGCPAFPELCRGPLVEPALAAPWARLGCAAGGRGTHGGFYLERLESTLAPWGGFDGDPIRFPSGARARAMVVVAPGRLLALAGGTGGVTPGLYWINAGQTQAARATEYDGAAWVNPSALVVRPDRSRAYVVDGARVLNVRTDSSSFVPTTLPMEPTAMAATERGLLLALGGGVELRSYDDLSVLARGDLGARITALAPFPGNLAERFAAAALETPRLVALTATLTPAGERPLAVRADRILAFDIDQVAVLGQQRYQQVALDGSPEAPAMVLPGASNAVDLLQDPAEGELLLVGGTRGNVLVLDTDGVRPLLAAGFTTGLEERITALAHDPPMDRFYALIPDRGEIHSFTER